jgi:hypothetical protein
MKLSEIKSHLNQLQTIAFQLPDGTLVPNHFHVTEVGKVTKHFIDCGGTVRHEEVVNFQLWEANDYDHRLHPEKLLKIIGKYGLDFDGKNFLLTTKITDCLAKDNCGIPKEKLKVNLSHLKPTEAVCCTPDGNCC